MKITHRKIYRKFSIYIDGILHFNMVLKNYVNLQSWFEGEPDNRLYYIEVSLKDVEPVLLEYTHEKLWKEILNIFDKHL